MAASPAAQDGRCLHSVVQRLLLVLALPGLVRPTTGASLRGSSSRGSVLMQVETKSGGKIALDPSEEFQHLQDSEWLTHDIADDADSGILDVSDESGVQVEPGQGSPSLTDGGIFKDGMHHAMQLQHVGRLVDIDNDARISHEELKNFAHGLEDRRRHNQTATVIRVVDVDRSSDVDLAELQAFQANATQQLLDQQARRFAAADADQNGRLNLMEFHAFVHPEVNDQVLAVEVERQMALFDMSADGFVDFQEFEREGRAHGEDFSEEAAFEDFQLHDTNADGLLSAHELGRLYAGNDLLEDGIRKAIEAGDFDGDGHIHVDHELPERLHHLLESEFIEDYFFHKHVERPGRHTEL